MSAANDDGTTNEFSPQVSATCKSSVMNIKVSFNNSYTGAIHARDYRNSQCMQFGDGSNTVTLSLNLLAREGQADYCGILVHNVGGDVRIRPIFIHLQYENEVSSQVPSLKYFYMFGILFKVKQYTLQFC